MYYNTGQMEITNTCQFRVTMLGYNREDYHNEVYCTDVNYRVNKWTNYHNNLNDPSSRIAGIRIFSQSYTSAKDSSDGMCHAIMVFEVFDHHEHIIADFVVEMVTEDFWYGGHLNNNIVVK